jgi:hypothetical protein
MVLVSNRHSKGMLGGEMLRQVQEVSVLFVTLVYNAGVVDTSRTYHFCK